MKIVLVIQALILILLLNSNSAHAVVKECSTYPLITYAERETIKKVVTSDTKPSTVWSKLSTKERIEVCRSIAKAIRRHLT
ncbi:hypothetical protein IACHDJAJ_00038 [Aeromonas phage vB_AdhS_TS3]|nr:hypothetical protein IACHDJAJ_00038 [Aeromonas phage vB_AdhS_TS3]